jgi:TPP-dependent pyruvate/acetoin dehydrogenase alpha subunit
MAAYSVRAGEGPVFLELMTARLVGHYIGDAELYRRPGELDEAKLHEPLVKQRDRLRQAGLTDEAILQIESNASAAVERAASVALAAPLANTFDGKEHVYA